MKKINKITSVLLTTAISVGIILPTLSLTTSCSLKNNKAPTSFLITNIQDINGTINVKITETTQLICKDNLGNILNDVTYSVSNLPNGLNFDSKTGVISGTLTEEFINHEYTITATSISLGIISKNATINIMDPDLVEGFGFVTYLDEEGATKSIEFTQNDLDNLSVFVSVVDGPSDTYHFENGDIDRNQLTGIVFGREFLIIDTLPSSFLRSMFYDSTQTLLNVNLNGLKNVTNVGHLFAANIFKNCNKLSSLSINFDLNKLISTGNSFMSSMFYGCNNLTSLSNGFNLPQNIETVGLYFASNMFSSCTSLVLLPNGFNLPQNIKSIGGTGFASYMFYKCNNLTSLPVNFNLPQNIES